MNSLKRIVVLAASMLLSAPGFVGAQSSVPPTKPQLGVYLGSGCEGRKRLADFETWLGRPADFVVDFLSWQSWQDMASNARWIGRCWRQAGKRLVISIPMLPRDSNFSLEAGARGDYDDKIAEVGRQLIREGHGSSVVRFGWEFNAKWYNWSSLKSPEQYVAYWRRSVGVLRGLPGAQFRFDWNPIIGPGMASPEQAYPGDDVVDIIGADAYNYVYFPPGVTVEQRWLAMRDGPWGLRWHRDFARKHGKPTSFPEWGTGTRPDGKVGGGDDPVFMRGMIEWMAENPPEYQSYWDYNAKDYRARISHGKQPIAEKIYLDAFGGTR
jgi:hypothetical protein